MLCWALQKHISVFNQQIWMYISIYIIMCISSLIFENVTVK